MRQQKQLSFWQKSTFHLTNRERCRTAALAPNSTFSSPVATRRTTTSEWRHNLFPRTAAEAEEGFSQDPQVITRSLRPPRSRCHGDSMTSAGSWAFLPPRSGPHRRCPPAAQPPCFWPAEAPFFPRRWMKAGGRAGKVRRRHRDELWRHCKMWRHRGGGGWSPTRGRLLRLLLALLPCDLRLFTFELN